MCKHKLKENEEQYYVFCTECGKRWYEGDEECFEPPYTGDDLTNCTWCGINPNE